MACKPGEIEIVHQGGNSAGCWADIPTYFDTYTKYINGERVLDLVDVGDYDIEQLYTVMYGALEPGEYYNTKDINGDGVNNFYKASEDSEGNEVILTVYGRDDKFQKYELSYNDWLETNPDAWQYDDDSNAVDQQEYDNFLNELNTVLSSEDPASQLEDFFNRWENEGITNNSVLQNELDTYGNIDSFGMASNQQILDRMIIGDGDWGATVTICETAGQPNCVEPGAIRDIWEDFGRHIRVIFKGLEIPGLPEWLPLPSIMSLPTIGQIWDKVTGTWNDEVERQIDECLKRDDDGDGTKNSRSYCADSINPAGVIMGGIVNAGEEIVNGTIEKVNEILDKEVEGIPCADDPSACAEKVVQVLGGIFGTIVDNADPTAPNIPPWMRAIIIGAEYGDDVIKGIEEITGVDVNDDGTVGIAVTSTQIQCWDGTVVNDEDDCPQQPGQSEQDCSLKGRVHVPDASNQTKGSCGGCLDDINTVPDDPSNPDYSCVAPDDPTQQEGDDCNTGAPLNAEGKIGPAPDFECIPNEGTTCTDPETGNSGNIENGQCNTVTTTTPTDCPNGQVRRGGLDDGECVPIGESCFSEPNKYPGDNQNINQGQINSGGFCDEPVDGDGDGDGDGTGDGTGEDCPGNQIKDSNGKCVEVGAYCNLSEYGLPQCPKPGSNGTVNTPFGRINADGDCVCEVDPSSLACTDPYDRSTLAGEGDPCSGCVSGFDKPDFVDKCTPITQLCEDDRYDNPDCGPANGCPEDGQKDYGNEVGCEYECSYKEGIGESDPNCVAPPTNQCDTITEDNADECGYKSCGNDVFVLKDEQCPTVEPPPVTCDDPKAQNDGEVGECVCNAGFDKPQGYDFCTSIEQLCADGAQGYGPDNELCGTANGCPEGQSKFDGVNCDVPCPTNPEIGANSLECDVLPPPTTTCNDPNAVNNGEEGDCRCKPGFVKDPETLLCVQGTPGCDNGATVESGCDTCPDGTSVLEHPDGICPAVSGCDDPVYAAANPEECSTTPPPEPPPPTSSGGGVGGAGVGAFSPFMAGIDYTPQPLPTAPAAPQKDYMAELDNLIKRSLFEGIV